MKKLMMKMLLCTVLASLVLAAMTLLFRITVTRRIDQKSTFLAAADIPPRTMITSADVIEVKIPGQYILANTCTKEEEIIGKYTDIQGKIPAGSPFYRTMLYDQQDLPDRAVTMLKKGQTAYAAETDLAAMGSVIAGMRTDIHLTIERHEDAPVTGCLMHQARVISVKDYQGYNWDDVHYTGMPYLVEIAVQAEDVEILSLAESTGTLRFFPASSAYEEGEAELAKESEIYRYLMTLKQARE